MTALEQLNAYLQRLELRVRLFAASRGVAIVAPLALGLTVLLVWISNRYEFAQSVVLPLRVLLFLALACALAFGLIWPLSKLSRRRVTRLVENEVPGFEQRLLTLTERGDKANPFTELLAEDALVVARQHQPEQLRPSSLLFAFAGSGLAAAAVLLWLIAAGPGFWGYGASLLWTGNGNASKRPLYEVGVQPGNKTIRRKLDQLITAQTFGFSARNVSLFAKHSGALKWEQAAMQPTTDGSGYQFLFAGLSDPVEYYVQADAAQSKHFTIKVKDLPSVKRVRVSLHYPAGLGLSDETQDPGGDIRAVEGTDATVSVLTDRPLERGVLMLENGAKLELGQGAGNWFSAKLRIQKDGSYHIAAIDNGEAVRISDDYFIESKKDEPPSVKIVKPGHDPRVSPIEEVPVTVEAADDFGVKDLQLHYSVNGAPEQTVPLSSGKIVKEAQGKTMLSFENFKVVPGDVVSFYATARDATTTAHSDIIFAQAEPFDYKFSQSQAGGGMDGGMRMDNQEKISERQKLIIAATFNQVNGGEKNIAAIGEHARFLSDLESKLSEQAKTLSDRMASRELGSSNSQFQEFSKLMTEASGEMSGAVASLKPAKWHEALAPEERALKSLLRAESLFRDIQVAFNQQGGGGGGGGAQRDLARMFDLELDTSKNQYETGQSPADSAQQDQQKAIDDAFQRLQMLAKRQQELADQNAQQQAFEQRWQEEQLRREAEELRQKMQQLAQNNQQGQQQQGQQSSQQGQQSSSASGSSSGSSQGAQGQQQSAQNQQINDALKRTTNALQRAEEQMRQAVSGHDATAQQRAAAQLKEAQDMLNQMLHQQAGTSVSDLAQQAQQLASEQKSLADQMKRMYGDQEGQGSKSANGRRPFQTNGMSSESASSGGGEDSMREMNDPNSLRFGYGFRHRNWQQDLEPRHLPSEQERALAGDKEKLGQQLEQLERNMQQQAQTLAGTQPDASTKMRKALSDAEQKELALRMQKDAEWMRQGYGDRNLGMEDGVTAGLEQLSQQLHDVERSVEANGQANQNGDLKTAQQLARVRALREQLERATQASGQANGNRSGQDGQQASGQPGGQQRGGQGNGQQGGQQQASGQQGEAGGWNAMGGEGPAFGRGGAQEALRQLQTLRSQADPNDRALSGYINGAIGTMQHLTGAQDGLLDARLSREAVVSLERLEVELNKRAVQQGTQGTRTSATEVSPEKYRDAVAEYFKKLSK